MNLGSMGGSSGANESNIWICTVASMITTVRFWLSATGGAGGAPSK